MKYRTTVPGSLFMSLLLGASALALAQPDSSKGEVPEVGFVQRLNVQVPLNLPFVDEKGRVMELGDYFDGRRPVVLSLVFFTCPMLCGEILNGVVEGLDGLSHDAGDKFRVLTVSFDPDDTPARASEKKQIYVQAYGRPGAARGWHFLTGPEESIRALTDAVGFRYTYDPQTDQFAHAAGLVILTPQGRVSRYLFGIEYPAKDLRFALLDASENKIGSVVEQLLLLCYKYDPASGTYTLVVHRVLQVAGVGTALTLVLLIGFLLRAERLKRRSSPEHVIAAAWEHNNRESSDRASS